ncbi:MAG: acyl carrier protein [Candidatus Aenigmarchaeota archaeon]|nr:acyl carrier protein [Candidatus Aenigmarchaeota archaeon]
MDARNLIKQFIESELLYDKDSVNVGEKDSLIETGVIDSLGIVKLLAFLEETFSIRIPDDELIPENFETIEAISLLIGNKMA